jgi:hypothetical protein
MSIRRTLLILSLVATILGWGFVVYHVVAVNTALLGPVAFRWSKLDRPRAFFEWSPSPEIYSFSKQHELQIAPQGKAQFMVSPTRWFSRGVVSINASGPVDLQAPYKSALDTSTDVAASREVTWSKLSKFPGGYRLSIKNIGSTPVTVKSIRMELKP